ncbi:hypothetical protein CC2G_013773 [Coprinopsis cinerea AmutBmut pab1-1]|nr:hypothetical protein CC2G_013773 [Coprinopsis cinerea AmutBmut pab1-1]
MAFSYKRYAAKEPLSSRSEVHKLDSGLHSVRGAQEVISLISDRRTVTKLLLGHNELGDDGCTVLFRFLGSQIGRRYPIAEISLNSNKIGNQGLLAISQYLTQNAALKELFIQANTFTGDRHVIETFAKALNSSSLETLSLTGNHALGDGFAETFFPVLNCPSLQELHISSIGLTPRSVPHLSGFIRSPDRCRLTTLKCNGNALGLKGVQSLVRAVEQRNHSLTIIEFHANDLPSDPASEAVEYESDNEEEEETPQQTSFDAWKTLQERLKATATRNSLLKNESERQALRLLRYARTLLLHRKLDSPEDEAPRSPSLDRSKRDIFPFTSLPIELQLHILSLLAPSLSPAQRHRIFRYAASPSTLPPLLPRLTRAGSTDGCLPDPGNVTFGVVNKVWALEGGSVPLCDTGECMGTKNTVSCHVEKNRSKWLYEMGCNVYEPH